MPEILNRNNAYWVDIAGGPVTLEAGGYLSQPATFDVDSFVMARYPVTNRQFAGFVAAGGYGQRRWWSDAGWRVKERKGWTEPRYWGSRDWGRPDCPVVGVSWYEAQAFCRWWSQLVGRSIDLPTEQQWQRAAQGDDGREYPWGDRSPEARLCNWNRNVDETTPVMQYPAGASPFGVLDMSGNVWEWCRTGWGRGTPVLEGDETRLLRGGCWSSDSPLSLRAANRNPKDPNNRLDPCSRNLVTVGFRVVG